MSTVLVKCRNCNQMFQAPSTTDQCQSCGTVGTLYPLSAEKKDYTNEAGDWGALPLEPCRFCHQVGGVMFRVDDSPRGKVEPQVVRCDKCGRDWEVD